MMDDSRNNNATCEKHGVKLIGSKFGNRKSVCRACIEEDDARRKREDMERFEKERREHMAIRLRKIAMLPERFKASTFENYEACSVGQIAAVSQCKDYLQSVCDGGDNSLILTGAVGAGKTHLGCAIANELIERIIERNRFDFGDVRYITVPDLISEVRSTWGKIESSEEEVFDKYGYSCLLVLDEAGVQRGTDDEHRILFNVINRRYESRMPTVVITNLAVANLDRALGGRVVDRLRENGKAVRFDWPSYRKNAAVRVSDGVEQKSAC